MTGSSRLDGVLRWWRQAMRGLRREAGMLLVSFVVACVGLLLYLAGVDGLTPLASPFPLPFWVACLLSLVAELFLVRIRFARETL